MGGGESRKNGQNLVGVGFLAYFRLKCVFKSIFGLLEHLQSLEPFFIENKAIYTIIWRKIVQKSSFSENFRCAAGGVGRTLSRLGYFLSGLADLGGNPPIPPTTPMLFKQCIPTTVNLLQQHRCSWGGVGGLPPPNMVNPIPIGGQTPLPPGQGWSGRMASTLLITVYRNLTIKITLEAKKRKIVILAPPHRFFWPIGQTLRATGQGLGPQASRPTTTMYNRQSYVFHFI